MINKIFFGCRLAEISSPALTAPNVKKSHDHFVRELFVEDPNSLKEQSKKGRNQGDGFTRAKTITDISGAMKKFGNPHGWGVLGYGDKIINIRSKNPASKNNDFNHAVEDCIKNNSQITLGHVRLASDANTVSEENTHPFISGKWSFMHNGDVNLTESSKFNEYKDEVDSKIIFKYFMDKVNKPNTKPQKAFAETIKDVLNECKSKYKKGKDGFICTSPTLSIITTDGNVVLGYKKGITLYVGEHKLPEGKKEYVLSSEMITPSDQKGKLEWTEPPDNSMVIIEKQKNGDMNLFYAPLEKILDEK